MLFSGVFFVRTIFQVLGTGRSSSKRWLWTKTGGEGFLNWYLDHIVRFHCFVRTYWWFQCWYCLITMCSRQDDRSTNSTFLIGEIHCDESRLGVVQIWPTLPQSTFMQQHSIFHTPSSFLAVSLLQTNLVAMLFLDDPSMYDIDSML